MWCYCQITGGVCPVGTLKCQQITKQYISIDVIDQHNEYLGDDQNNEGGKIDGACAGHPTADGVKNGCSECIEQGRNRGRRVNPRKQCLNNNGPKHRI